MPNNPLKTAKVDFKLRQHEFAAYIRNPNNPVPAGIKPERMATYRELFFNNIESFLSNGFPVLRKIYAQQWQALVQDFFSHHQSQTPYFSEIAEEFLDYLQNERHNPDDFPFLLELAHYEWVEMALSISQAQLPPFTEYIDDFLQQKLIVSPLAWPLAYRYPVHQIAPDFLPIEPPEQPTYLIVYRNWDDEVHFLHITALIFRLLQIIEENPHKTVQNCLNQLAEESAHPQPETIKAGGLQALQELFDKSIVAIT